MERGNAEIGIGIAIGIWIWIWNGIWKN